MRWSLDSVSHSTGSRLFSLSCSEGEVAAADIVVRAVTRAVAKAVARVVARAAERAAERVVVTAAEREAVVKTQARCALTL